MTAGHPLKEKHKIMATPASDVLATYYIDIKPRIVLDDPAAEPVSSAPADDADVERDRATLFAARALIEDDLVIVDRDHDELRIEQGSESDIVAYFVTGDIGTYIDTVEDLDKVIEYLTAIRTVKALTA